MNYQENEVIATIMSHWQISVINDRSLLEPNRFYLCIMHEDNFFKILNFKDSFKRDEFVFEFNSNESIRENGFYLAVINRKP